MNAPSEATRAYIYRVATPVIGLLTFYGIVSDNAAPLWLALVGAATTGGLAIANTSTSNDQ